MQSKRLLVIMISVGLAIAIGGCQTGKQSMDNAYSQNPELPAAALPEYAVGEFFAFDDGRAVVVTAVSNEQVTWRYSNGTTSTGYRNFILPALAWKSANRRGEATSTAPPHMLWPLAAGNRGHYNTHQVITGNDQAGSTQLFRQWYCSVEGTQRVSVPAGSFDTYVIACDRYSSTGQSWRATRRYYYAPDLGHYVIREDQYRSRPVRTRQLVAYGFNSTFLPKQEQVSLNRLLQKTLSNNPNGVASTWTSQPGDLTAKLVPVNSYAGSNGSQCRDYYSLYSFKGRVHKNERSVCRLPEGRWQRVY